MKTMNYGDGYIVKEDGSVFNKHGKMLSSHDNGKGYLIVSLSINGKRTSKAIHRILAECFIPNPDNLSDVDHVDGNRQNNAISNLRWLTHGENIEHSYNLSNRSATGENNSRCETTEEEVREICRLLSAGYMPSKIRDLGFDYGRVRAIKRRQNWTHISKYYSW